MEWSRSVWMLGLLILGAACGGSEDPGGDPPQNGDNNCRAGCESLLACSGTSIDPLELEACVAECTVIQRGTCGGPTAAACIACFANFTCADSAACAAACDIARCGGGGGGSGGTGGTGGTGGVGGTGGSGGSGGSGGEGGSGGGHTVDCSNVEPFLPCTVPDEGSACGELVCTQTISGLLWVHPCTASSQCPDLYTFCLAEGTGGAENYCFPNYCDDSSIFLLASQPVRNGNHFEACDTRRGFVDSTGGQLDGVCIPYESATGGITSLCMKAGSSPPGGTCDPEATRADPDSANCAAGALCTTGGICTAICNAGTAGGRSAPFAACSGGDLCFYAGNRNPDAFPDALGVCIDEAAAPCAELDACTTLGQRCVDLTCTDTFAGLLWARPCTSGADCRSDQTFCLGAATGGAEPYCWLNFCDANSLFRADDLMNGTFFGACDSEFGFVQTGRAATGTCLPFDAGVDMVVGVCVAAGSSPVGGACEGDADRWSPAATRCAQGSLCLTDGTCGAICNAGTAGAGSTQWGGCGAGAFCFDAGSATDGLPWELGICGETCDVFSPAACPTVGGENQYCHPLFTDTSDPTNDPVAGVCLPQTSTTRGVGQTCSPAFTDGAAPSPCADGSICLDLLGTGTATCAAFCDCTSGFDANGVCLGGAAQCAATATCEQLSAVNERIGVCVPN